MAIDLELDSKVGREEVDIDPVSGRHPLVLGEPTFAELTASVAVTVIVLHSR